jgi:hypothetical protein
MGRRWLGHKKRYQGMRWITPKRIRAAAAKEIRTAQVSREMRGVGLVWVGEFVLLILLLLLYEIREFKKSGMDSLSQLKSVAVVASVAEAATRPTRSSAGAGSGMS